MSHTPFELSPELVEAIVDEIDAFADEHHCPSIAWGLGFVSEMRPWTHVAHESRRFVSQMRRMDAPRSRRTGS